MEMSWRSIVTKPMSNKKKSTFTMQEILWHFYSPVQYTVVQCRLSQVAVKSPVLICKPKRAEQTELQDLQVARVIGLCDT